MSQKLLKNIASASQFNSSSVVFFFIQLLSLFLFSSSCCVRVTEHVDHISTWHFFEQLDIKKHELKQNEHEAHVAGCIIKVILHHVSNELPQFDMTSPLITV